MRDYTNVMRAVTLSPWAILPESMATIRAIVAEAVQRGSTGTRLSREEIDARVGNGPGTGGGSYMVGSVAVLPLSGAIIPRATLFSDVSGGTSCEAFRNSFLEAIDDPDVSAILFDVNSPGGMVDLVPELAQTILGARGTKPVVAVSNTLMASAAYWLSACADEVYVTESGDVGSIGVITMHDDYSGALEREGVKTTLITAGKFKGEGNPYEPLSDDDKAALQRRVDEAYDLFVRDVAAGRGIDEGTVRAGMGEGRLLKARRAQAAGLVDGIQTFEGTLRGLASPTGRARVSLAAALAEPGDFDVTATTGHVVAVDRTLAVDTTALDAAGTPFVDEAESARVAVASLVDRMRSLAELDRGRLTTAKRDALTTLADQLVELTAELRDALDATAPEADAEAIDEGLLEAELAFAGHEARLRLST